MVGLYIDMLVHWTIIILGVEIDRRVVLVLSKKIPKFTDQKYLSENNKDSSLPSCKHPGGHVLRSE